MRGEADYKEDGMRAGLQDELDARREQWQAGATPERRALYEAQIEELRASGLVAQALAVGSLAPGFSLPDARGGSFALSDALSRGPVVLVFYRGGWCPYCNIALKAYQRVLPEINALGAELVAISPERPDLSLSTTEKNDLAFTVLSDTGNRVADAFRLVYQLPTDLAQAYASNGIDLAAINAADEWRLPVPATFIIAATGRVTLAHIEVDYRRRLDPDAVLAALRFADKGMVA
jgi:peroxiredoxin